MKRLLYILLLLTFAISVSAQNQEMFNVTGQVTALSSALGGGVAPVSDVIVKLTLKGRILAFGTTDTKGNYSLRVEELKEGTVLSFAHISYEAEEVVLKLDGRKKLVKDMVLVQKSISLKEVKVRANPLLLKGDTLSYNLASFLGKGDVTLEDGLKRLPGIEVSKSGAISYMGKGISAFNIEGLDMLGGKYNLATRNMGADMVTKVEVVRNYHARKMDKDKPSDAVALNIKLADKAKFKPFGQEEAGAGRMQEGKDEWLGMVGVTGMMFTDKFQTIGSVKIGNYKNYGTGDMTYHYGTGAFSTHATSLFSGFSGGNPPQGESEYRRNGMVTLNAIIKLDSARTMRVNADYIYNRATSDMASATTYLSGNGEYITVSERTSPLATQHLPILSINYRQNESYRYTNEDFALKGKFEHDEGHMHYQSAYAEQYRRTTSMEAKNRFNLSRTWGEHRYYFDSDINFQRTPSLRLTFSNQGESYGQTAQSTRLSTVHGTSFDIRLGKKFTMNLPVNLQADYDFVETVRTPSYDTNRLSGWTVIPSFRPGFEWQNSNRRFYASISAPVAFRILSYGETSLTKLYSNPYLNLNYTFSANNKLSASTSISHGTGDMLDLLIVPMQTDYRSVRTASGVIGESRNWNTSVNWNLQIPLNYFTLSLGAGHNEGKRNTLYSQSISGVDVSTQSLFRDTYTRNTSFNFATTKSIPSIFAKFGINGNYYFGDSEQAVHTDVIKTDNHGYNLNGDMAITPLSWMEINYHIRYGWSQSSYGDTENTTTSLTHHGGLRLYPLPQLEIAADCDYVRRQLTADRYKHMSLFNGSVQYKFKQAVLRLELDNLLNQRSYAYTLFDGINTYSYDYGLCGRTAMLKLTFKL